MRRKWIALSIAGAVAGWAGGALAAAVSQGYSPSGEVRMDLVPPEVRATLAQETYAAPIGRIERLSTRSGNVLYETDFANEKLRVMPNGQVVDRTLR